LIADLRFGQLLESVVWTIKHDVGDSLEHAAGHVFRCALVGERDVENGLGLGGHLFRKIKRARLKRACRRLLTGADAASPISSD
jgi:hypothetical protein